jgi:hypothetical protein
MRSALARLAVWGRLLCALALLGAVPMVPVAVAKDVAAEHAPAPARSPARPPLAALGATRRAAPLLAAPRRPVLRVREAGHPLALRRPPPHPGRRHAPVYLTNRALLL